MKKVFLGVLALSLIANSCSEDIKEDVVVKAQNSTTVNKKNEFSYTNQELLKISSILLSDETLESFASKKSLIAVDKDIVLGSQEKNSLRIPEELQINYFGLGAAKDSLIISVKNKVSGEAVILSKDKRLLPVLAVVNEFNGEVPPAMLYYLNKSAENLQREVDYFNNMDKKEVDLKRLNEEINDFYSKIATEKIQISKNGMVSRTRNAEYLASILGRENVVYVKEPLLKTTWNQNNKFISQHPIYRQEPQNVEGCVTTAVGQVLKFWENNVKKITFGNPYGGEYFNYFTQNTFHYPYRKNSIDKYDHEEIQFNISQQITRSAGSEGRGAQVINHLPGVKDLRNFINENVEGVKVVNYTGYTNMVNNDEHYVINSIEHGRPAITAGSGHAWVCDGLVKVRVRRGVWPVRWTEHKYYIHMNWGWDPSYNGWFFTNGGDSYVPRNYPKAYQIYNMISIGPN